MINSENTMQRVGNYFDNIIKAKMFIPYGRINPLLDIYPKETCIYAQRHG